MCRSLQVKMEENRAEDGWRQSSSRVPAITTSKIDQHAVAQKGWWQQVVGINAHVGKKFHHSTAETGFL